MLFGLIKVKSRLPEMRKRNHYLEKVLPGCWCAHQLRGWVLMAMMWNGLLSGGFPFSLLSTTSGNSSVDVP